MLVYDRFSNSGSNHPYGYSYTTGDTLELVTTMSDEIPDPIRRAAELISGPSGDDGDTDALEYRLKKDIFTSIGRIKPKLVEGVDFDNEVANTDYFASLTAPLQGIAISRCEGALAFYNRIGWHKDLLDAPLDRCVPDEGIPVLNERYHASTLHDLAYVHPKHFAKMLGKAGSASLWETLKRYVTGLNQSTIS